MEIDVIRSLEITYSRWNRNHPAKNEIGLRITATVLNLASALTFSGDNSANEILLKAQSEFKLNDSQTEKLLKQAELISNHAQGMPERLGGEIKFQAPDPTIMKSSDPGLPPEPVDVFELTGKELNSALSRLDPEERRVAIKYFINGKTASQIGIKDANADRKIASKLRRKQFGRVLTKIKTDVQQGKPNATTPEIPVSTSTEPDNLNDQKPKAYQEETVKNEPSWAYTPIPPKGSFKRIENAEVHFPQTTPKEWSPQFFQTYIEALGRGESFLLPSWKYPEKIFIDKSLENLLAQLYKNTPQGESRKTQIQKNTSYQVRVIINRGRFSEEFSSFVRNALGYDAALSVEDFHYLVCRDQFNPLLITVTSAAISLFFRARDSKLVNTNEPVFPGASGPAGNYLATSNRNLIMYVKNKDADNFRKVESLRQAN